MRSTEPTPGGPTTARGEPIPLRELSRWLWLVPLLLLVAYLAGIDQGAISRSGMYVHELMHDGRHLLAVPCH